MQSNYQEKYPVSEQLNNSNIQVKPVKWNPYRAQLGPTKDTYEMPCNNPSTI